MTKHHTKTGHMLSKALAARNRQSDGLQAILTVAGKFPELMEPPPSEEELLDSEKTPKKPRRKKGDGKWEDGFKLMNGKYTIRVQRHGKRVCVSLNTNSITEARDRRRELETTLVNERKFGEKPQFTVQQIWEAYEAVAETNISKTTLQNYRSVFTNHVLPLIGEMEAEAVTNEVVQQVLAEYLGLFKEGGEAKQDAAESLEAPSGESKAPIGTMFSSEEEDLDDPQDIAAKGNRILQAMKVVFYSALAAKRIRFMPFDNQKVPTQPITRPYVTLREIPVFLKALRDKSDDPNARELQGKIAIFLGPRSKEIRLAKGSSFDLENRTFTPKKTKTKKKRVIPIPSFLAADLKKFMEEREVGPNDYLFTRTNSKRPVGAGFLRHAVQQAGQVLGKPSLTPHRLRSSFATLHAIAGTPIRVIQAMLGHSCIQTTLIYIEDVPELNVIAQQRLEALAGFGNFDASGLHNLRPWHTEIGQILGNVGGLIDTKHMDPSTAAVGLLELTSILKTLETAILALQGRSNS